METLIKNIKEKLGEKKYKIKKMRGQISGADWVEVNITNIKGEPILAGTSTNDVKIRIQPLLSGTKGFSEQDGRIDNCHEPFLLHKHSGVTPLVLGSETISWALGNFLGYSCWEGIE